MSNLKCCFLLLAFSAYCLSGKAQEAQTTLGSVTISSPTAASLGKFGDIPVGYHTGVPNVQIPIYTVQAGPLKLPIGLSYHASGLKVMEPASWVGAGWALDAGGVITRTVQGQPDEAGTSSGAQLDGHFSNYGYNSYFYTSSFGGTIQDWQGFSQGIKDGEPDLFFFNFGGYSGKFFFRDDRTPVLVPEQDLQIVPSYSGGRSINSFTITTPDGAKYVFGNSPNVTGTIPIETTNCYSMKNGAVSTPPTSSWYLNEIVSADNQFTITLSYQPENYGYYTLSMFPIDGQQAGNAGQYGFDLVKDLIQGVRLSQISFPNGTVNFNAGSVRSDLCDNVAEISEAANTSATSLGGIQVTDGAGLCKNYTFHYTYFSGDNTALPTALTAGYNFTTDETRLRLDSVNESSCDASTHVPAYKFTYDAGQVPRRLSFAMDHWGYYNGATGNAGLIPTIILNSQPIQGATRDPAWPAMLGGELTRIDYPTGGYNVFTFESNSALVTETIPSFNTLGSFLFGNLDGQGGTFSGTASFTSNGNAPNLTIQTNCNYGGLFTIYNSSGTNIYQITYNYTQQTVGGTPQMLTYQALGGNLTPLLPPGNYTITASLSSTSPTGGVAIALTQPTLTSVTQNVILGGLRIKTITAYDGLTSNNVVTNYSYNTPGGSSTAVLYSVPTYAMRIRNNLIQSTGFWSTNGFYQNAQTETGCPSTGDYILSPGSIRPMATVQGGIVGYQMVTVSQPGNGYSVYNYYTANNGYSSFVNPIVNNTVVQGSCDQSTANFPTAPLPFDSKRGELYYEQHYDNNNNLLKDIYYAPVFNETPILSTPAFICNDHNISGGDMYLGTMYSLNTVRKTSMTTTEDDYGTSGGYVTTIKTTYYGSNFHNQPTSTTTTTSTGDQLSNKMTYVADFRLPACDAISDCSTEYNTACASCQTTYNSASAACNGSSTCITTAYLNFMQCNTNARTSYVSCRNTNYMGTTNAFNTCHLNAESSADATLKPVLLLQDAYVNGPIETNQWRDALLLHSSFVNYAVSTNPANFAYPSNTQLINLQVASSSFTPAVVSGSTIAKDNRYLNESLYSFSTGNPLQVTPHDGVTISYIWDYLNTEPIAKVTNAVQADIAYTSFESTGQGNWSFSGATSTDVTSPTGTKCYSLSGGAISRTGLSSAKSYIVSYWSKTTSYSVSGSGAPVQGRTVNGWTYYEHTVTGVSSVSVSGSGAVDELRLYPATAQMTTYTYAPLIGMTSQCDIDNHINRFNYDPLGRLRYIVDQDGNIVKTYQYHYKGQTTN